MYLKDFIRAAAHPLFILFSPLVPARAGATIFVGVPAANAAVGASMNRTGHTRNGRIDDTFRSKNFPSLTHNPMRMRSR